MTRAEAAVSTTSSEIWGRRASNRHNGASRSASDIVVRLSVGGSLWVTRSLSRPQVSDGHPFSEAQFKTLKYHPGFPGRFEDIATSTAFCRSFFPWYNTEHRHAGIAMLTPHDVHFGRAGRVLELRERTLRLAWNRHPDRFVRGTPKPQPLPNEVWINPPAAAATPRPAQ